MLERLREAVGTGEVLRVVYDGGSSPGAVRDLIALQITANGMVRARCLATGQVKTFTIAKMHLRENAPETYTSAASSKPHYANLAGAAEAHALEIQKLGWHVQLEDDDEGGQCLSVHRVRRSGQPMKGSFASLTYKPQQWDLVVTPDGGMERSNFRPSVKPFTVRGKWLSSSPSFRDLDRAVERFLEAVRAMPLEAVRPALKTEI